MNIMEAMQQVSESTLPMPVISSGEQKKQKKVIPGWREEVKPFRDLAYFWNQVWESCGRPINTEVHKIMKRSRNRYHYEMTD